MSLKFKKSVNLGKGVKLNLNKKSAGISFGGKGHRTSVNSKGRVTNTVGIPGSGLYYTSTIGKKSSSKKSEKKSSGKNSQYNKPSPSWLDILQDLVDSIPEVKEPKEYVPKEYVPKEISPKTYRICGRILLILSPILFVLSLLLTFVFPFALILVVFSCFLFWLGRKYKSKAIAKEAEQDDPSVNPEEITK